MKVLRFVARVVGLMVLSYVAVFGMAAAVSIALYGLPVGAAPAPLVQVGQTYLIVESCTNVTGKCFGEIHRVTAVLEDQWVETKQCEDQDCAQAKTVWRINLAHVYALRPYRGPAAHDAQ